ncbi:Ribosomal RNA processing protein 1-like protein [Frankliniella fusca]|uniref:Ribosomal RNA processing protein 1-like protein n=1 Tax=Frankliniella fusca TaxID=407009 RepID=A0AAE1GSC2_9NEOP|nr:Ribosomal RNA processing protein 1-like protein [Frankliniella fusca]
MLESANLFNIMVTMKNVGSSKLREENGKTDKQALLVAQEISFAKVLAGNDKKLRDRGVKRLRKWLMARSKGDTDLKKGDFKRLWKGLFYCMWMADKPLFQEELAETISSLIHCFQMPGPAVKFIEGFFIALSAEWKGIDQHRLDKFLMFVRRFLRQSLVFMKQKDWNIEIVQAVSSVFKSTLLPDHLNLTKVQPPLGLVMHFTEIYLEELAKVSGGDLDENVLLVALQPFAHHLAASRDSRIRSHIRQHIFIRLLEQSSVGLEFQDKFAAWSKLGFPGGNIDVMERDEDELDDEAPDEDDDEVLQNAINGKTALDPRAGKVDVELPIINFNPKTLVKFLEDFRFKKFTNVKTRKVLSDLIDKFEKLSEGDYPLGIKELPEVPDENIAELTETAAEDLCEFESQLLHDDDVKDNGDVEDDEDSKENNEKISKKNKKDLKRKKAVAKKVVAEQKKARLEVIDESVTDNKAKVIKKKSKKEKLLLKKSLKKAKMLEKVTAAGGSKSEVDVELEKIAHIEISPSEGSELPDSIKSDPTDVAPESATHALLQHLAPHVVGSKKLKRRASCGAKLQSTPEITVTTDSEIAGPSTSKPDHGKKLKKRKSLGWDEPLQEGEYEIFIPREKIVAQKKRLSNANESLTTPPALGNKLKNPFASPAPGSNFKTPSSSSKKVNFVLQRNTAQATSDYFRTLRENPEIPYDANKEPKRSALKPSPYSSPVNPFYKRKLKM